MSLKAVVKISSVTNLSDARYCAGMGVEMLGFDLRPGTPEYVTPLKFQEITGWVAGVELVGEVTGLSESQIRTQMVQYPVNCLEVSDVSLVPTLMSTGVSFIVRASVGDDLESLAAVCATYPAVKYLFVEMTKPLSAGEIEAIAHKMPLLLGYFDNADMALPLLRAGIKGFVLRGSQEFKPGFTDYEGLASVLEALEQD